MAPAIAILLSLAVLTETPASRAASSMPAGKTPEDRISFYRIRSPDDKHDLQQGSDLHFGRLGNREGLWMTCDRNGGPSAGRIYFISARTLSASRHMGTIRADECFTITPPAEGWEMFASSHSEIPAEILDDLHDRIEAGASGQAGPRLDLEAITVAPSTAPPEEHRLFVVAEEPYSVIIELILVGNGLQAAAQLICLHRYVEAGDEQGSDRNDGLEGLAWTGRPGEFYWAEEGTTYHGGHPGPRMFFRDPRIGRGTLAENRLQVEQPFSDRLSVAVQALRKGPEQTLNGLTVMQSGHLLAVDRNGGWILRIDPASATAERWLNLYDIDGIDLHALLNDFPAPRQMPYISIEGIAIADGDIWLVDDPALPEAFRASCLIRLRGFVPATRPADEMPPAVQKVLSIGPTWSGHPVGFCLLTHQDRQYVAYYDEQRRMTVAARRLDEDRWEYVRLPSTLGWDSHNYITMTVDDAGCLHLCGNMHGVPLIYFRTDAPHDIHGFRRIPQMIGTEEDRVTYPQFFRGAGRDLIFTYRDGGSGKGRQIYNVYDTSAKTWRRLLDKPLLDGEGKNSAYLDRIQRDRQGLFHLCWAWRSSPDCATNHDVCYARSRDLVNWERSDGVRLSLPITLRTSEIVDPVPAGQGLINGNVRLGFDDLDRPVISYHKYDEKGHTQVYNARLEDGSWRIRQVSNWDYRWEFSGGGSIRFEIGVGPVERDDHGRLLQSFHHPRAGSGQWLLDPPTLASVAVLPARPQRPAGLAKAESQTPGMQVRWSGDIGDSDSSDTYYLLRWETLPPNRDRPREGSPPPPSALRLFELRHSAQTASMPTSN